MSVERTYIGDSPVTVAGVPGVVEPGDTVTFEVDPNHPLFVTKSEADKRKKTDKES